VINRISAHSWPRGKVSVDRLFTVLAVDHRDSSPSFFLSGGRRKQERSRNKQEKGGKNKEYIRRKQEYVSKKKGARRRTQVM